MNTLCSRVVNEFCAANRAFTSIEISNEIKRRGHWMSNTEVAFLLKRDVGIFPGGYVISSIFVEQKGTPCYATLYHQVGFNTEMYTARDITAITPDEFAEMIATPTSRLMRVLRRGKANAIKSGRVEELMGEIPSGPTHERVRDIIRKAIHEDCCAIGSCSKGYFIIDTKEEMCEVLDDLQTRIDGINNRKNSLYKSFLLDKAK